MINQLLLVGIIKKMPVYDLLKNNNELIIEVKRNYKNSEGVFEKDCFKCYLWFAISKKICLCCKEGDLVAIRGRIVEEDKIYKIVAEQVVLLNKNIEEKVFDR